MPSDKTTVKIDGNLNKSLSIICLLEKRKKEELVDEIIREALKPYFDKYERYKFK